MTAPTVAINTDDRSAKTGLAMHLKILVSIVFAVWAPGQSAAQETIENSFSIERRLTSSATEKGFTGDPQIVLQDRLREGRADAHDFIVRAGEIYLVAGSCDARCTSLGLRITNDVGSILNESHSSGNQPALVFRPETSGTVTVATAMAGCSDSAGCGFGVGIFAGGPAQLATNEALSAVHDMTDERARQNAYVRHGDLRDGVLQQGESVTLEFTIDAGTAYAVIAQCDDHCTNLDLKGFGIARTELAADVAPDSSPVLLIEKGSSGGMLTVRVDMERCDVKACAYAAGTYTLK